MQWSTSMGSSSKEGSSGGRVKEVEGSGGGAGVGSGHQLADMRGGKVRAEEFV